MLSLRFLLLLPVLFISTRGNTYKPIYKVINTTLTGTRNVTYHFDKDQGLTARDKQAILDMHNTLRGFIAIGNETRGYLITRQPSAGNMQALSWDDALADFSQAWADTGAVTHSSASYNDSRFTDAYAGENMSGDMFLVEEDMYGEVRWWNFDNYTCQPNEQCGHYKTFVNGYWAYMGCGWKKPALVCNFVGLITLSKEEGKKRTAIQHEYIKGAPCSLCEQGFDYCMSGGLCATKAQCESDPKNNCSCLHNATTCAANGGTFDQGNCRCKCPADRYGINCKNNCENTPGQDNCGSMCTSKYVIEAYFCNKVCNGCGKDVSNAYKYWYVDRTNKNRDNVTTRAFWPDPVVTPPPLGNCANKVSDDVCALIAQRNYCVSPEYKNICPKHCNTCGYEITTTPAPSTDENVDNIDLEKFDLSGFKEVTKK